MTRSTITVEVCVDTLDGLNAAIAGGADRIELCSALALGGLSPSRGLLEAAARCPLPVRAMVRPIGGGFLVDPDLRTAMLAEIRDIRAMGLEGVVCGALTSRGELDRETLGALREAAGADLAMTLHRCVDLLPDPVPSVDLAADLGIETILTSGGAGRAVEGVEVLHRMTRAADGRVQIMAGSGLTPANVADIISRTGVAAVHASCSIAAETDPDLVTMGFQSARSLTTDAGTVRAFREAAYSAGTSAARPT